jgi:hypothetical protein
MPSETSTQINKEAKAPRVFWTDPENAILVGTLKEQKEKYGKQSGAGWKPEVWTICETALKKDAPTTKESGIKIAKKCGDHYGMVCLEFFLND